MTVDPFFLNLCKVLAHSIYFESKEFYSPDGIVDDAKAEDGPDIPNPNQASRANYRQAIKFLPGLSQVVSDAQPVLAQGQFNAAAATSPQYAQLDLLMKQLYGGAESDANAQIADRNATNLARILRTSGADVASSALDIAKIADPEYYKTRETTSRGIENLIGGQDPNRLTSAELENATRGVNRTNIATGNTNPSQTQSISNALTFGDKLSEKRQLFGQALGIATGAMPAMKSGVDTFRQVTGSPGTSGLGDTQFGGVQKIGESGSVNSLAGNLYSSGSAANTAYASNTDQRGDFERIVGSLPDYSG